MLVKLTPAAVVTLECEKKQSAKIEDLIRNRDRLWLHLRLTTNCIIFLNILDFRLKIKPRVDTSQQPPHAMQCNKVSFSSTFYAQIFV